jgi:predicted Zn finger-like uncharacterized protein
MFTVCPKCALTLVVTAADLRVAQGYVRCGRCSNVFNALARLSEDRQAAAAAAQAQAPPTTPPASKTSTNQQLRPDTTFKTPQLPDPGAVQAAATGKNRQTPDLSATARLRQQADPSRKVPGPPSPATSRRTPDVASTSTPRRLPDSTATSTQRKVTEAPDKRSAAPPPLPEPKRYGDDSILDEDLEFNPEATDLTKVFVEQPPSPQFTAATGTFKAIRLEAEDGGAVQTGAVQTRKRVDEHKDTIDQPFDPVDTQVDVEIDPDLLDAMAQLTSNRLPKIDLTSPPPSVQTNPPAPMQPASPAPTPAPSAAGSTASGPARAAVPAKASVPAKQPPLMQPPFEQPPQAPAPMRLAERAKARVEAARPVSIETAQAIRTALLPRKRSPVQEATDASGSTPTPFFAGLWTAGSALLVLLLAIQVVHHYRHDLAASESLNGPLTSLYAVLGIPLVPRWNLNAYEVRQLGASTAAEAPGQITVRASVKNGAHQAQPLPLLRVTLQDRFGNRIAARDVPPQSYLPRAIPRSSLLSAGQRIDAEMAFVDPGSNAVGFEIDACLPAPGGGISCANDAARQ